MLTRLVAFPESKRILNLQLLATPFLAVQLGVLALVPMLLRKHFSASEWETTIVTTAIPVMCLLAIFWNEAYRRLSARWYLLTLWLLGAVPMVGISWCDRPGPVLIFIMIAAAGMGGLNPIVGDLLRNCYPPKSRSKVLSVMKAAEQLTIMVSAYAIGVWLDHNGEAYRLFFPICVMLIGVGMLLLYRITQKQLFQERLRDPPKESLLRSLRNAYRNMTRVLAADERFRRYETAFCVYGIGWMMCSALLPFMQVDVLHLQYGQAAWSSQVAYQVVMMLMLVPTGYVMDRMGPIRMSSLSFTWLLLYPVLLMLAKGAPSLAFATVLYAMGMTGINLAWTIGPVTLARGAAQASHYLAIHATLVAVRALLGPFPAVLAYKYTGRIWIPLAGAGVMFAIGAILMIRLERSERIPKKPSVDVLPLSTVITEVA